MNKHDRPRLKRFNAHITPLILTALAVSPLSAQATSDFVELGGPVSECKLGLPHRTVNLPLYNAAANAAAVSADGNVVVGTICDNSISPGSTIKNAVLWQKDGSRQSLGSDQSSSATAVSADGSTVVGKTMLPTTKADTSLAFRWTSAGGLETLAGTPSDKNSIAHAVSGDGSVVVGTIMDRINPSQPKAYSQAFRWTSVERRIQTLDSINATGLRTSVGMPPGTFVSTTATGVSADGRVVVGASVTDLDGTWKSKFAKYPGTRAFRWTESAGFTPLATAEKFDENSYSSWASASNDDGSVIVGYHSDLPADQTNDPSKRKSVAFRWTEAEGTVSLSTLPDATLPPWINEHLATEAVGVSGDGRVVVGRLSVGDPTLVPSQAFRWTKETGMQTIEDWLSGAGVNVASDQQTYSANGSNADGTVVVGQLRNGNAFIARVAANGSAGSGIIDVTDFNRTLVASAHPQLLANAQADQVLHGAHSAPLRMLLKSGQQDVWVTGDWGRQAHEETQGSFGSGEVGVAHGLSDALMLKLAVGHSDSESHTLYNGSTRITGTYVVPELIAALPSTDLYASVSGYYSSGEAEISRSYLNAGTPEIGRGTPDTQVSAVRLRLDWRDALRLGDTAFTPYTSYTHARSQIDGYSESGGGFPVRWDRRDERSTLIHTGIDARHHLNARLNLIARLEGVHRMEDASSGSSGEIVGLSAFELKCVLSLLTRKCNSALH